MSRPQIKIRTSVEQEYRVTCTSLELLYLPGRMNIGNIPLDSLLVGLDDKEVTIDDNDEDKNEDDDDEDLDSEVFRARPTRLVRPVNRVRTRLARTTSIHLERKRKNSRRYCSLALLKKGANLSRVDLRKSLRHRERKLEFEFGAFAFERLRRKRRFSRHISLKNTYVV